MNSRRLPTDSAMRMHNAAVGRDPVYNSAANGSRLLTGVFTPTTRRNCCQLVANSCTHRRRDATRQFHLVGVGGVHWALHKPLKSTSRCLASHEVSTHSAHECAWTERSGRPWACLRYSAEQDRKLLGPQFWSLKTERLVCLDCAKTPIITSLCGEKGQWIEHEILHIGRQSVTNTQ